MNAPPHSLRHTFATACVTLSVLCSAGTVKAGDPVLTQLQDELRQLFRAAPWLADRAGTPEPASPSPHAIVSREFLFATPVDALASGPSLIMSATARERTETAKSKSICVKIFTPWWHGAGVLISPQGDVLTSYHLVAGAPAIKVLTHNGQILTPTNVVRYSAVHDLALLRLPGGPYPAIEPSSDAHPAAGQPLRIIGHPDSRLWNISTGQTIRVTAESGTDVLHFDSDIGPGNSGGPVVDAEGRLCAITACAAVLADGSKVKVGVSAEAIRRFLATPAAAPITLGELAVHERNRQAADILEFISTLIAGAFVSWPTAMSGLSLQARETAGAAGSQPASTNEPRYAMSNTWTCAQTAARLLVLRLFVMRCAMASGLDETLQDSATQFAASLDALLTCTESLSRSTPQNVDATRAALRKAREAQDSAQRQFGMALQSLSGACRRLRLNEDDPRRVAAMERMAAEMTPPGCHVDPVERGRNP